MEKKQQNRGGGIVFYIILAAIIGIIIFSVRSFNKKGDDYSYSQFVQDLNDGIVSCVTIKQNEQAPTGKITVDFSQQGKESVSTYVTDVNMVEKAVTEYNSKNDQRVELDTKDITKESVFLTTVLPFILVAVSIIVVFVLLGRSSGGGGANAKMMNFGKSRARLMDPSAAKVTFDKVAGLSEEKEELEEIVDFLKNPGKYVELGARIPKGVILVGPPGTGKTLIAKAVAGEAGVPFFSISGSDFVEMFVGVGASRVRDLFEEAKKNAPCIIFIDEIDAIGKSRDSQFGGNDEREQTLNQLLSEMDGFDSSKGVLILAATNRPEVLDKALLRPGRFDRRIIVDKPDLKGRLDTLKVHSKDVLMDESVDLEAIALATAGAVGSDLANIINEAAINAVKHHRRAVNQEDLFESVEVVIAGKEKKDRILGKEEKKMVAYHEVGHALVTALTKDAEPVQKITIVPRTMGSLGYTMQVPEEEKYLYKKEELEAKILTLLGGRAAEEIIFGTMTTGASNDIERATKLARTMISQYGMSDRLGIAGFEAIENKYLDGKTTLNCSDKTAAVIDEEVIKMLKESYIKTKGMLQNNLECLHKVSEYLLEKESITGKEFMEIVNSVKNKNEESDNND